jgi:hypothetical protein
VNREKVEMYVKDLAITYPAVVRTLSGDEYIALWPAFPPISRKENVYVLLCELPLRDQRLNKIY